MWACEYLLRCSRLLCFPLTLPVCNSTMSHCADNPIGNYDSLKKMKLCQLTSANHCWLSRSKRCHGFILKQLLLCTTPKMCCLRNRMAQPHVSAPSYSVLLWETGQTCISIPCTYVTKVWMALIFQYTFQCCICRLYCYMCDLLYCEPLAKLLRLVLAFHEHCFTLWRPSALWRSSE